MDWYRQTIDDALQGLQARATGLSEEDAQRRLERFGLNKLPEEGGVSRFKIAIHQFASPLIYILLISAIVTFVLREFIDTGVIMAILILNAIIGFLQEYKAEESMRALKNMLVAKARVIREGVEKEIVSEQLVPGDIVALSSGGRVPADIRLMGTTELRIEEAALTGESVPVEKTAEPLDEANLGPGDQRNMAFMGTIVVNGRGRGVVAATGVQTILGQIARDVKGIAKVETPLQQKIGRFARLIGFLVLGSAMIIGLLGLFLGIPITELFKIAVAASVAAIPEGLPIVVTVTMAIGIRRMAQWNAIIRKLPSVETLGSTTVICSDKTGTLTKNEMTVKIIFDGEHSYEVTGSGYEPHGDVFHEWDLLSDDELKELRYVLRIGMLCNESSIYQKDGRYTIEGDPTEAALIVSAMKVGLRLEDARQAYRLKDTIPFESHRGYMATLHEHDGGKIVFVKGAPEKILEMCSECRSTKALRAGKIFAVADRYAQDGMRVLAMAYKELPADTAAITERDMTGGFVLAGIQGIIDPPRPEVIEAIKGCKEAGIRVVMVTGDHAVTATAIGRMVGIVGEGASALTGRELETISDEELFDKVRDTSIFARVSPDHKLRIVQQLMQHGEVVAVTGDGVNDAPALKAAHIGVAMGKSGTDVAKEAADMVVTDDNFSSIFHAVREGRVVFDNIRKVVLFLIPTGLASILSILITMIMGLPIPYVAAQLLWINLVTNGLQDVALAFEPGEKDVLRRKPRSPREGIMSALMLQRSLLVGIVISLGIVWNFCSSLRDGSSLEHARTMAVTTMVFFQFFQAWNSRSEIKSVFAMNPLSNPFLFYSMVAAFLAQLAVLYVPALQWIFRTAPLALGEWVNIAVVAFTVVAVVEIDKALRRTIRRKRDTSPGTLPEPLSRG